MTTAPLAQEDAADNHSSLPARSETTERDYETLRRLLGLPSPGVRPDAAGEAAPPPAVDVESAPAAEVAPPAVEPAPAPLRPRASQHAGAPRLKARAA